MGSEAAAAAEVTADGGWFSQVCEICDLAVAARSAEVLGRRCWVASKPPEPISFKRLPNPGLHSGCEGPTLGYRSAHRPGSGRRGHWLHPAARHHLPRRLADEQGQTADLRATSGRPGSQLGRQGFVPRSVPS